MVILLANVESAVRTKGQPVGIGKLRFRPGKVAKLYQSIWTAEGSPLLKESRAQASSLQQLLDSRGLDCAVELAMTYGEPSVSGAIENLRAAACERILVIPLYHHGRGNGRGFPVPVAPA